MASVPLKPQYGPTLGQLIAPRWRAIPPLRRRAVIVFAFLVVVAGIGAILTFQRASITIHSRVSFSFQYRDLYRRAPDPGGYAKVTRQKNGRLLDLFAVDPLRLPAYQGSLTGELPLYADSYIKALSGRFEHFNLQGEGKTRINKVPGYGIYYTAVLDGQLMYGRNVLLLPEQPGVRDGVQITMLSSPDSSHQVHEPEEVASAGVLNIPLHTFSFN